MPQRLKTQKRTGTSQVDPSALESSLNGQTSSLRFNRPGGKWKNRTVRATSVTTATNRRASPEIHCCQWTNYEHQTPEGPVIWVDFSAKEPCRASAGCA
jgi:hypothetical protein